MGNILVYPVRDPSRYGVINFDVDGKPLNMEKPSSLKAVSITVFIFMIIVLFQRQEISTSKR